MSRVKCVFDHFMYVGANLPTPLGIPRPSVGPVLGKRRDLPGWVLFGGMVVDQYESILLPHRPAADRGVGRLVRITDAHAGAGVVETPEVKRAANPLPFHH